MFLCTHDDDDGKYIDAGVRDANMAASCDTTARTPSIASKTNFILTHTSARAPMSPSGRDDSYG